MVRSLLGGEAAWLALLVALNAVVGLAYYLRFAALLYAPADSAPNDKAHGTPAVAVRPARLVAAALAVATALAVLVGFAPQLVLDLTGS